MALLIANARPEPAEGPDTPAEVAPPPSYAAREPFQPLHRRTQRWAIAVAHRRAGKTVACVNELIDQARHCPKQDPRFAYIAPQLNQAKDIAWQYLKQYAAYLGKVRTNESELWIEIPRVHRDGSEAGPARVRIYGADNPNRLRGLYLDGAVLDEFGDMDPTVWSQVIRPALSDRKGWAVFIGTPRGKNAFHALWTHAETDDDWFALQLKASETGLIDAAELADAARMMSEDEYAQEYECSFEAAVRGAYYGKEINAAEEEDRLAAVAYDPRLPVHTAWDLGMADSTVIWFIQVCGHEVRVIDVLKGEGVGLDWYARELQGRNWLWGNHYLPHDVEVRELGTGKSRKEVLAGLGVRATVCPNIPLADGIQAVRMLLPSCRFDKSKCKQGIEALRMYRREYDEKHQEFRVHPLHDWCFSGDTQILTRYGTRQIDSLPFKGQVLTPCGWRHYHSPRVTRHNAPLVEVRFTDGLTVRCTPDHMFKTESGWKSAESLVPGSQIQSCLTRSRSISMEVFTAFGLVKRTIHAAARSCIETLGPMLLGRFPRAVISTTGTATPPTTRLPILSAWMPPSIGASSGDLRSLRRAGSISMMQREMRPPSGTVPMRGGSGTSDTLSEARVGLSGSASLGRAFNAAKSLLASFGQMVTAKSSAIRTAKRPTIASVRPLTDTSDVWCITVPGEEAFSLANGAVVHNCSHYADALRYFAVGHRPAATARKIDYRQYERGRV